MFILPMPPTEQWSAVPPRRFWSERPPVKLRRTLREMLTELDAMIALVEANKQRTPAMPAQVTHLSGVLRAAKEALAQVPNVSAKVLTAANELKSSVGKVEALADEMKSNTVELNDIINTLTNGGPPIAVGE